ncbi:hypothetical protein JW848_03665 [Candidatus Bipolaricaulota bacterium]|nr:hypothetical protein [Candidatus Bipolaricaulota bacterium]
MPKARERVKSWAGRTSILTLLLVVIWAAFSASLQADTTQIVIDGNPSDWTAYPEPALDLAGDALGSIDILAVAGFVNDDSVYVLVLLDGNREKLEQVDIDFDPAETGPPFVRASARAGEAGFRVARFVGGQATDLGGIGALEVDQAVELRLPRSVFDGAVPSFVSVRVIDADLGKKHPADETEPTGLPVMAEADAAFHTQANLTGARSLFCSCAGAQGEFAEAVSVQVPDGYRAEYFIAPSGLNTPTDVVIMQDGAVLVASSRAGAIEQILPSGEIAAYAQGHVYAIDCDQSGHLFGYNFPSGEVFAIERGQPMRGIARVPDTACESTLAVSPDGVMYIGHNFCSGDSSGQSTIYRISPGGGQPTALTTALNGISALDVDSTGTLHAAAGGGLYTVDGIDGTIQLEATLSVGVSFHGLAVDDSGTTYVSTGDFDEQGGIYRLTDDGMLIELARFTGNGIEGIAIAPDGAVIGTQRSVGGLQRVSADGVAAALVVPNGLVSPHSLAMSPCDELVTVNDEAGRLTIACADGLNRPLISIISFQPPQTHIAFSEAGWFVAGESAPGFPSRLNLYLPDGRFETLASDLDNVSGVAVGPDGAIYAAATGDGTIVRIELGGTRTVIAEGLASPQALAVSPDGTVYAVVGGSGFGEVFSVPPFGDAVVSIDRDGVIRQLAHLPGAAALAFGPDGRLVVAAGPSVFRLDPWGIAVLFARGFQSARGVAFDSEGRLYVADDDANAVIRICPLR